MGAKTQNLNQKVSKSYNHIRHDIEMYRQFVQDFTKNLKWPPQIYWGRKNMSQILQSNYTRYGDVQVIFQTYIIIY